MSGDTGRFTFPTKDEVVEITSDPPEIMVVHAPSRPAVGMSSFLNGDGAPQHKATSLMASMAISVDKDMAGDGHDEFSDEEAD